MRDASSDCLVFEQSDLEDTDNGISSCNTTPKGRKKIRKIIEDVDLRAETQEALREEEERRERLANRDQQMEDRREVLQTIYHPLDFCSRIQCCKYCVLTVQHRFPDNRYRRRTVSSVVSCHNQTGSGSG